MVPKHMVAFERCAGKTTAAMMQWANNVSAERIPPATAEDAGKQSIGNLRPCMPNPMIEGVP